MGYSDRDVAVVGLGFTLPDARTKTELTTLLEQGWCSVRMPEYARLADLYDYFDSAFLGEEPRLLRGAFLQDIAHFDPEYFGVTPAEAAVMNPYQRLALLVAYEALWDAGYPPPLGKRKRVGVFVGGMGDIGTPQYREVVLAMRPEMRDVALPANMASIIAGRISYAFDLAGPASTVDTACSSSLYALHLAKESLRRGECELALVGGVRCLTVPFHTGENLGMESPDGFTRTFDSDSLGTGYGEGAGFVVLKKAVAAIADGDHVYAVIKGSAANQDGRSNGITAPDSTAQTEVLLEAWDDADIDPDTLGYYETHGTGTKVGDVLEMRALARAFASRTSRRQFCAAGSFKTNIGHLLEAAGVAALIKICLSLESKRLYPSLHMRHPNPLIEFEKSPLYINTAAQDWVAGLSPRRAALSAFGFSGTNIHVVLEEANIEPSDPVTQPVPIRLSAGDIKEMMAYAAALLADWRPGTNLADVAHTLSRRPTGAMSWWCMVASEEELLRRLRDCPGSGWERGEPPDPAPRGRTVPLAAPPLKLRRFWVDSATRMLPGALVRELGYTEVMDPAASSVFASATRVDLRDLTCSDAVGELYDSLQRLLDIPAEESVCVVVGPSRNVTGTEVIDESQAIAEAMVVAWARERGGAAVAVLETNSPLPVEDLGETAAACRPGLNIERDSHFYQICLSALSEEQEEQFVCSKTKYREPTGAIVCSGGTGVIGMAVAEYLASDCRADIVLLSRSGKADEARLEKMRRFGARVEVLACDVTDPVSVTSTLTRIRTEHGGIRAISHAAGSSGGGFLAKATPGSLEATLWPKVRGALNLEAATRDDDLEFFLLHSSWLSTLIVPGQGEYAMANAFLDAFAARRNREGHYTPVVRWAQWAGAGMAVRGGFNHDSVIDSLRPRDAVAALHDVLVRRRTDTSIGSITRDPELLRVLRTFDVGFDSATEAQIDNAIARTEVPANLAVRTRLVEVLATTFALTDVDVHRSFFDLGADSIMLARLRNEINREFGTEVTVADLFGHPNIVKLAEMLDGRAGVTASPSERARTVQDCSVSEPIAVVGMALELPDVTSLEGYWELLVSGGCTTREMPPTRRADMNCYYRETAKQPARYEAAGYLERIDLFDRNSFGIGAKEADLMDPQQRLFLTTAWRALCDAGFTREMLAGSDMGVFAGYASDLKGSYLDLVNHFEPENVPLAVAGNLPAILPARVAYAFDLTGPSMVVDTACSSSLVAIDLACQALRRGECSSALAGGVRLQLMNRDVDPRLGIESESGTTRPFDERADGASLGEGAGVVVLKPLSHAKADGDRIYGLVLGGATNQDGHSAGITAPNPQSQVDLLCRAWGSSGIDPSQIGCIETHGTGTPLGDQVEFSALQEALSSAGGRSTPCLLGAGKSNFGHLFEASGVMSFIKMVLQLQRHLVPGVVGLERLNPAIQEAESFLRIPNVLTSWEPLEGQRRVGGVSAFGLSGTNCHMVLAEYPEDVSTTRQVIPDGLRPERCWITPAQHEEQFFQRSWVSARLTDSAPAVTCVLGDESSFAAKCADALGMTVTEWCADKPVNPGEHAILALGGEFGDGISRWIDLLEPLERWLRRAPGSSMITVLLERVAQGCGDLLAGLVVGLQSEADATVRVASVETGSSSNAVRSFARSTIPRGRLRETDVLEPQLDSVDVVAPGGLLALRDGGNYLITGGAGGLGLAVAEHFASNGHVKLHLVGRRVLSPGGSSPAEHRLDAAMKRIRDLGSTVEYHSVDVASTSAMAALLERIGPLHGVVHAAGVAQAPGISVEAILRPKINGLIVLDALLGCQAENPDFLLAFSSVATTLPAMGQAIYVAANSFVESFVESRRAMGMPYQEIQWVMWRDIGMAADAGRAQDTAFEALDTHDALRKLDAMLGAGKSGLIAGDLNSDLGMANWLLAGDFRIGSQLRVQLGWSRGLGKSVVMSNSDVINALSDVVASVSGGPAPDPDMVFSDLGLDSVAMTHLYRRIEALFPGQISVADLFSYPSVRKLADHLAPKTEPEISEGGVSCSDEEPIAVIGMACRLPFADTPDEFFKAVKELRSAIGPFPVSRRRDLDGYLEATGRTTMAFHDGGYLDDVASFDSDYFGISAGLAGLMDPHQRIMLQTASDAFEDAGYPRSCLNGTSCGVFVGFAAPPIDSYAEIIRHVSRDAGAAALSGNLAAIMAGRIAFTFDLKGPALVVDTACSSALTAVLLSIRSLMTGECDVALVGGVRLDLVPDRESCPLGIEAPDGITRPFDAAANGTGFSEGAGAVVLKRLSDAQRDGDTIHAVILGGAMNHDGLTNGITAPSARMQADVIAKAQAAAGITPGDIRFIEAHGTGTPLGDPVEIEGLTSVFRSGSTRPCAISSVKANIGHTFEASGIISLIHAVNCLRYRLLPPLLHFREPNPALPLAGSPLYFVEQEESLPADEPIRCGVSSFGFSGTNVHLVLQGGGFLAESR